MDVLHAQKNLPTRGRCDFHDQINDDADGDPSVIRGAQGDAHLRAFIWVMKNPIENGDGDGQLQESDEDLFHSPNCSFQIATERRISSAVLRGLISQTNKQSRGRSGTSFLRSISPAKGGGCSR